MCIYELYMCVVSWEAVRGCPTPGNWSNRHLWAATWVLGIEPGPPPKQPVLLNAGLSLESLWFLFQWWDYSTRTVDDDEEETTTRKATMVMMMVMTYSICLNIKTSFQCSALCKFAYLFVCLFVFWFLFFETGILYIKALSVLEVTL